MTTTSASQSFINVGERTNVTGSAKFRKLVEADDKLVLSPSFWRSFMERTMV